ncbi:ladybird early [Frankliniella occidentalis]|nr:ladybird early [Frankliniella occidentalis]
MCCRFPLIFQCRKPILAKYTNRRAKLKRDMEELKKDVESAKVLTAHKSFLEKVHSLGVLKKKAQPQEKPPVPEK